MDEWVLDDQATYVDPCKDCANLTGGAQRVTRGGNYGDPATALYPWLRGQSPPPFSYGTLGFRCARTP